MIHYSSDGAGRRIVRMRPGNMTGETLYEDDHGTLWTDEGNMGGWISHSGGSSQTCPPRTATVYRGRIFPD